MKVYGKSDAEKLAESNAHARDIVREILRFGVTQSQLNQIIKLLAMELEDHKLMVDITKACDAAGPAGSAQPRLIVP